VDEYVLSTGTAQKAVPFRVVKPLHGSLFHWVLPCFLCEFPAEKIAFTVRWDAESIGGSSPKWGESNLA
jgi:hypothetical protein